MLENKQSRLDVRKYYFSQMRGASIRVAYLRHGVTNLYGLLTVDQERCHPPYKMCWQAHVTEFRNEQFVVDWVKRFAVVNN